MSYMRLVFRKNDFDSVQSGTEVCVSNVYTHYELQDTLQFDLLMVTSGFQAIYHQMIQKKNEILDCFVIDNDGNEIACNLYLWFPFETNAIPYGLVCKKTDVYGNINAHEKYNKNTMCI